MSVLHFKFPNAFDLDALANSFYYVVSVNGFSNLYLAQITVERILPAGAVAILMVLVPDAATPRTSMHPIKMDWDTLCSGQASLI